jgi:hypothetical protein
MANEEGVPLDELLIYVERAVRGDLNLHIQLLETMRRLAGHPTAPPEERALGDVVVSILLGDHDPDFDRLPPEAAAEVQDLLERLKPSSHKL